MKTTLSESSKFFLEKKLGITIEEMAKKDSLELDKLIEEKIHKKLGFMSSIRNQIGRGNVFLYLQRFLELDTANKRIAKI